jgi:catechol 2,3-dioxygenase
MSEPRPLPDDTQPVSVRLQVSDLARSRQWYTRTLGCQVLHAGPDELQLGTRDAAAPLITLVAREGTRPIQPHSRLGLYHYALLLPSRGDLGAFVRHLVSLDERIASADHLVSEALYLHDPDGLGIEMYCDRPRSAWTYAANGHVVMTVDSLDLRDLADAANAPWSGLPSGTTLGHMHLHVGDLDRAAAFYRDGIGFDETASLRGALFLAAGGYHHHLGVNVWAAGAPAPGDTDARLLEWTLRIPDASQADAVADRLTGAGHEVVSGPDGWTTRDPWGTALRVVR